MRRAVGFALGLTLTATTSAWAGPLVVWLEDEVPPADVIARADHKTGGSEHTQLRSLLFPETPFVDADAAAIEDLRGAVAAGLDRWDEFEIELAVAQDLQLAIDEVRALRSREDAEVMLDALVFQGAAVARAFDPDEFARAKKAEPFRTMLGAVAVPTAWIDAHALVVALGRDALSRQDFIDNNGWQDFQRVASAIAAMPGARLTWSPAAGSLVVDGRAVTDTDGEIELRPGHHRVHLVRSGVACAAAALELPAGKAAEVPALASPDQVGEARRLVAEGSATGLPEPLRVGLASLEAGAGGPLYVGAVVDGRMSLAPFSAGVQLETKKLFSAVLFAEVGGGIHLTKLFEEVADGKKPLSAAISGGAGVELGVSYFLIGLGMDAAITPGRTIASAGGDGEAASSVFPQPWGGLGAYILRPVSDTPTLSVLGEVNWNGPAHLGYGGRVTVGIPIDARRNWLRISAGATYAPSTLWSLPEDPLSLMTAWLRLGLGARL